MGGLHGQAARSLVLGLLFLGTALAPLAPAAAVPGPGPMVRGAGVSFDLPPAPTPERAPERADEGPATDGVPKAPNEDTLGYTTNAFDMDRWKKDTDGAFSFDIDMGPLANLKHVRSDLQRNGYWLRLGFDLVGYFRIDGDGVFDDWRTTSTPPGDEPCHNGRFDLFKLYVNGRSLWTSQGENERPCNTEGGRLFDLVPMTSGEAANQWRVPADWVRKDTNTVRIELLDTGYTHPQRDSFNDGWWMYLRAAQMQLVAPPLFISGGWSFDIPPGGHGSGDSGWEGGLASTLKAKMNEHFAQDPWDWAPVASVPAAGSGGCRHVPSPPFDVVRGITGGNKGVVWFGKDGKQDFRVTGCQVARVIRSSMADLGYSTSARSQGGEGFWYIGFSMGGLIGRWAVQREGLDSAMGKFVTFGTPHFGSHWANEYTILMDLKPPHYRERDGDRLRGFLPGTWHNWYQDDIGANWYKSWHIGVCTSWTPPFVRPCIRGDEPLLDHRADFELKPMNPVLVDLLAGVGALNGRAFAVSGQGGSYGGLLLPPGLGMLVEGDGVVPTDSATMGGAWPSAFCSAIHSGGSYSGKDGCTQPTFEVFTGFRSLAAGAGTGALEPQSVPLSEIGRFPHEIVPPDTPGPVSVEDLVHVDGGAPSVIFMALWSEIPEALRFTVVSPSGVEYTEQDAAERGAEWAVGSTYGLTRAALLVPSPEAGDWRLRMALTEDAPDWGVGAMSTAALQSALGLKASAPVRVDPGAAALLTAQLSQAAQDVSITAHAAPSDVDLALHDDGLDGDLVAGDGIHSARYTHTTDRGEHVFEVTATGTFGGASFERTARASTLAEEVHDIAIAGVGVAPGPVWFGDAARVSVTVRNVGGTGARGIAVVGSDDSDSNLIEPFQATIDVGSLGPGMERTVSFDWTPSPGLRTLRVEVLAAGLEELLADNEGRGQVEVLSSPRTAAFPTGPLGSNGWYVGPVSVALAPFNGAPRTYAGTSWRLDGGAWQGYAGPFGIAQDGAHVLEFQSTDASGSVEPLRTASIPIDATAPSVGIARPSVGANALDQHADAPVTMPVLVGPVEVEVRSSDATSGVARLEVRVDGLLLRKVADPKGAEIWQWDSTGTSLGRHLLTVKAWDRAGLASSASLPVYVAASRAVQVDNDPHATLDRVALPVG